MITVMIVIVLMVIGAIIYAQKKESGNWKIKDHLKEQKEAERFLHSFRKSCVYINSWIDWSRRVQEVQPDLERFKKLGLVFTNKWEKLCKEMAEKLNTTILIEK